MTMTTASLMTRAQDGAVDEPTLRPDPEARLGAVPTAPSTRSGFWLSTTCCLWARRSGVRCCAGRGCIARIWRSGAKARDAVAREGLAPKAKARRSAEQVEMEKLRRKNQRLEVELARTKLALEITGKAHALLELLSESAGSEARSKQ